MGTQLHQALRILCFNTEWKYAVFWKLKRRSRTMLTWEDAYYDNHEQLCHNQIGDNLHDWHLHDPLGFALARMSYHVYSLGEGLVGRVAVTGKHMWIFTDKHINDSCSSIERSDGWQTQFSAGIRTVVAVGVVPHGVLQLGSLYKIPEDLKMVNQIRDALLAIQDSSIGYTPSKMRHLMESSSCLSDLSTRSSGPGVFHDCTSSLDNPVDEDRPIIQTPIFGSLEPADGSYCVPLAGESRLDVDRCGGETSCWGYRGKGSEDHDTPSSKSSFNKINLYNVKLPSEDSGANFTHSRADLLDSAACNYQDGMLYVPEPIGMKIQGEMGKKMFLQSECDKVEPLTMPFQFSADCELYEVLGPAFRKQNSYCDWEAENTGTETAIEMPEGVDSSSVLMADPGSEHLLEAVVANVSCGGTDVKSEKSFCESTKSLLTTEKLPERSCSKLTDGSADYSFDQSIVESETGHCLSSEASGVSSSKGFSSRSHITFSGQLGNAQEPARATKKRARPGENSRPRPRDRQLIQDRIKGLRELVPNGLKCSIDSLLERTIKHILFMQSITKHAEKLKKLAKSKWCDKETVLGGLPNYDQGSTWAVEVGSHPKVCPIKIENINTNGLMLIEMLCEDCNHFLEIAEAVRSLGLTILKAVTEACGKQSRICFLVEGQITKSMHRMDVLWSLVQILQSKTTKLEAEDFPSH